MKQHITQEQLNELSEKGKNKLQAWLMEKNYLGIIDHSNPFEYFIIPLSIGQMIEFLQENLKTEWSICAGKDLLFFTQSYKKELYGKTPRNIKGELCDGLWQVVKEILENK